MATWNKPAGFRFIVRNRGMNKKRNRCRLADRIESAVMKSDTRATLKNRIWECLEYDCFTTVALSCHREIVPEVILYYYDVYCNNKYYISTFYKKSYAFFSKAKAVITFIAHDNYNSLYYKYY